MSYIYVVKKSDSFKPDLVMELFRSKFSFEMKKIREMRFNSHTGALFSTDAKEAKDILKKSVQDGLFDFDVWCADTFPTLRQKGQICLDMDMTSVQIEGIDEIARRLGVFNKVADITNKAMMGGLDFAQSLTMRVAMLEGGKASVIEDVKKIMKETDGLDVLMECVSEHHWVKGICSGGFEQLICVLEKKYNLDLVCANSLEIVDGKLTGKVDKRIVDADVKQEGVMELQKRENIPSSQIIVLGDGANDLRMIECAGLGIAYHAKPLVQKLAPHCINHSDLTAVALLLKLNY